jgi:hypothetical protein
MYINPRGRGLIWCWWKSLNVFGISIDSTISNNICSQSYSNNIIFRDVTWSVKESSCTSTFNQTYIYVSTLWQDKHFKFKESFHSIYIRSLNKGNVCIYYCDDPSQFKNSTSGIRRLGTALRKWEACRVDSDHASGSFRKWKKLGILWIKVQ